LYDVLRRRRNFACCRVISPPAQTRGWRRVGAPPTVYQHAASTERDVALATRDGAYLAIFSRRRLPTHLRRAYLLL